MIGDDFLLEEIGRQDISRGLLSNQRLIVSDHVSVSNFVTGIGIPAWAESKEQSESDASVVAELMASGCRLLGKGQVDDFGVSQSGRNAFYNDLRNPAVRKCRVGGSSSGAAVAVASGKATLGLGNACNGGVIIPASYCGLYGYRPTPDVFDFFGIRHLSASFDCVGFLSKSAHVFQQIFEKYTGNRTMKPLSGVKYASTAFSSLLPEELTAHIEEKVSPITWPRQEDSTISKLLLSQAEKIHSVILGRDIEMEYGQWLDENTPELDTETQSMLDELRGFSFKNQIEAKKKRVFFSETVCHAIESGEILVIPTTPGVAPGRKEEVEKEYLLNQRRLIAIAEVAGMPQLTVPFVSFDEAPMGLSLLARPNEDRLLFDAAMRWF